MQDKAVLIRGENQIPVTLYIQSNDCAFGPFEIDADEGDILQSERFRKPLVVSRVKRVSGPGGRLQHARIELVSQSEWAERKKPVQPQTTINQHFHSANVVAGHSINGPVNITVSAVELFQALQKQVEENPNIPEEEKRSLLAKLKDFVSNSYVANLASSMVWDGTKATWSWITQS